MAENSMACVPNPIAWKNLIVTVAFHPTRDLLGFGDIEGNIVVRSYGSYEDRSAGTECFKQSTGTKSCRAVKFSPDGANLFCGSKDKSWLMVDVTTQARVHHWRKSHEASLYSMQVIDDFLLGTGDEDGTFKLWDYRQKKCALELKECDDYISDMVTNGDRKILVLSSGEGTLTAVDVRGKKLVMQSEQLDSEQLSLGVIKTGRKVVSGASDGVLRVFNWFEWGAPADRMPLPGTTSIDCVASLSDDMLALGTIDGNLMCVQIHPNRVVSATQATEDEMPVEAVDVSRDRRLVVTCSHAEDRGADTGGGGQAVRFWSVADLTNTSSPSNTTSQDPSADVDKDSSDSDGEKPSKRARKKKRGSDNRCKKVSRGETASGGKDFFADL